MNKNKTTESKTKVSFGFKQVTVKQKRLLIKRIFSDIADKYDLMNDLMSLGIHRIWKNIFCKMISNLNSNIIDVASGTGDIALRVKEMAKKLNKTPNIVVCDNNYEMLKVFKDKVINKNIWANINLVVASAENLPFADNSFDYYTIAFGIRNVLSVEDTLKEAYRVLKPTGKFLCLEFSQVKNDLIKKLYNFYSFNIIPNIGKYIINNKEAYEYLTESISIFPNQEDLKTKIQNAKFVDVSYKNLTFGVAAIHCGYKI